MGRSASIVLEKGARRIAKDSRLIGYDVPQQAEASQAARKCPPRVKIPASFDVLIHYMRKIRWIPNGGGLVEVTTRTIMSKLLLTPSQQLNEIIVGVLARARQQSPVRICALVFMSNHYHMLLEVDDAQQLARFMGYFNSNLAREVGFITGWREKIWGRRYHHCPISEEEQAQVARLRYVLEHGAKENLVASPLEWPGVHCAQALITGEPLRGLWFDRTREYSAKRRRSRATEPCSFATAEMLQLDPLPCWRHLDADEYRRRVAELVSEIELQMARHPSQDGAAPVGAETVQNQQRTSVPTKSKKSPAPVFHTATKAARRKLREAYAWFVREYREASVKLRAGDFSARFPEGAFPPALPFVQPAAANRPP